MEKKSTLVIAAAVTFIVGVLLSGVVASYAINNNHAGMMKMYGIGKDWDEPRATPSASSMSMDDMTADLKNKSGDGFDAAFIAEMIVHHQGAIDMADLAKTNAKHQEIKDLADAILKAQTGEIGKMKQWQKDWGYSSSNTMMNGHDMMGM